MSEAKKNSLAKSLYLLLVPRRLKEAVLHRFAGLVDHFLRSKPFIDAFTNIGERNATQIRALLNPALRIGTGKGLSQDAELLRIRDMVEAREVERLVLEDFVRRCPAKEPVASIVIPVFNNCGLTYRCLRSLILASVKTPFEVIVVDNASSDHTREVLGYFGGAVRTISNDVNLGFVEACNQGAAQAKGRFIVFLNNDTEVKDGWLDRLVETTELFDGVGAVGAKLLYPTGMLQEAGGIVWRDASGANYGRLGDPLDPEYIYLREVDYCSGACLLVRAELFKRLGGFDMRYAPAYYEDTDLCFGIRSLGYKVLYQPLCEIVHYEGATAGTDLSSGFKRFQNINRVKFAEKWHEALDLQPMPSEDNLDAAADRRTGPRILFIDRYAPRYDEDSGSFRMFNCIKILSRLGCRISFMVRTGAELDRYGLELGGMGVSLAREEDGEVWDKLKDGMYDLVLISRAAMAAEYLGKVKKANPRVPVVFDTVDLHFVREMRMAELHGDRKMKDEALKMKEKELSMAKVCDLVVAITDVEKEELLRQDPGLNVIVVPNIHPEAEFTPSTTGRTAMMFIGGFAHPPNVDAMLYFTKEIYPLILRDLGELELLIVGSDPPEEIMALASDKVTVTGYVPQTAPYFGRSRVFVSPLRYGAGMKGKIGDAMSHGLPVVTTSVGAEGIGLVHGETAMIHDDPAAFAADVARLYRDDSLWMKLAVNGRKYIAENYGPEAVSEKLAAIKELAARGVRA